MDLGVEGREEGRGRGSVNREIEKRTMRKGGMVSSFFQATKRRREGFLGEL